MTAGYLHGHHESVLRSRRLARAQGEPDAGPRLLSWAHSAGFDDVTPSASVWCFASPDDRAYWRGNRADRVRHSRFAEQALAGGCGQADLDHIAAAWQRWAENPDGRITVTHGEILGHRR